MQPLILAGFLACVSCKAPSRTASVTEEQAKGDPVAGTFVFNGGLGEEFTYSSPMSVEHNPHGAADKVFFKWEASLIGALFHIPLPPFEEDDLLAETVIKDIKKKMGATTVKHTTLDNPSNCHFNQFQATVSHDGKEFEYRLLLFFDKRPYKNVGQEMLRKQLGGYKIEFIVPQEKYEKVRPHVEEFIASFKSPVDRGP